MPRQLYETRTKQRQMEAREAAGESLWTPDFSSAARNKLWYAISKAAESINSGADFWASVQRLICEDRGLATLGGQNPIINLRSALVEGAYGVHPATIIEGVTATLEEWQGRDSEGPMRLGYLRGKVNEILRMERISFEMIGDEMVSFESKEMHTEVVAPALRLLSGRAGWEEVESAYQDALREISEENPADAITDAGRALQEALTLLGAKGNKLGPLVKSAKGKGLLGPHDTRLTEGIDSLMQWVSAERSEMGEAHKSGTDDLDDAWLAVHVVGALILRLAGGGPRA